MTSQPRALSMISSGEQNYYEVLHLTTKVDSPPPVIIVQVSKQLVSAGSGATRIRGTKSPYHEAH
jgi:hypothetical protein